MGFKLPLPKYLQIIITEKSEWYSYGKIGLLKCDLVKNFNIGKLYYPVEPNVSTRFLIKECKDRGREGDLKLLYCWPWRFKKVFWAKYGKECSSEAGISKRWMIPYSLLKELLAESANTLIWAQWDSDILTSRTVRKQIYIILSHVVYGNQLQKQEI